MVVEAEWDKKLTQRVILTRWVVVGAFVVGGRGCMSDGVGVEGRELKKPTQRVISTCWVVGGWS